MREELVKIIVYGIFSFKHKQILKISQFEYHDRH